MENDIDVCFIDLDCSELRCIPEYEKEFSIMYRGLRKKAYLMSSSNTCFDCKKENTKICNSHFVPKSFLRKIALDGKVYLFNKIVDVPALNDEDGLKNAGTFKLICHDCDIELFKNYENFDYKSEPCSEILSEISTKNHLNLIYKRMLDAKFQVCLSEEIGSNEFIDTQLACANRDTKDYINEYLYIKRLTRSNKKIKYNMIFFKKLKYTVPLAFQGMITIFCDFKGNIINDTYSYAEKNILQSVHVCVFPQKNESTIMMFYDEKSNKYRNFRRQFQKFSEDEQLSIINYILFKYSEDIFISKNISQSVISDENLLSAAQSSSLAITSKEDARNNNSILKQRASEKMSLNNFREVPNLLSEEFKITSC